MNNEAPNGKRQGFRGALTTAIMFRVQCEVEDVIATLAPEEPEEVREAIRQEVLPHSRFCLDSLTLEGLQNDNALDRQVANAVAQAQYFVDRIKAQRGRS